MCTRTHTFSVKRTTSPSPFGFTSNVTKSLSDKNSHLPSIEYQLFKITQKTARMCQMGKAPDYVLEDAAAAAAAKSLQSCLILCDPTDGSPPGSPVPGILQARTLQWAASSFSNAWKWKAKVKSLSRCLIPSDPTDCNLPGSSVHGIFQTTVLEWVAIAFSLSFSISRNMINMWELLNLSNYVIS